MKGLLALIAMSLFCGNKVYSQSVDSYDKFRQQVMSDYQGFRKSVLDNYADYLNTVWKDFQTFKGVKRDETPKPTTPPDVKTKPAGKPTEDKPTVNVPKPEKPVAPTKPVKPAQPVVPATPIVPQAVPNVSFPFYGMSLKAPKLQCIHVGDTKPQAVASVWKGYEQNGMKGIAKTLQNNATTLGLNDWFTYEMVHMCVDSQCKQMVANDRVLLKHYLLANMGYDIRLALMGEEFMLLIGIQEQVYARRFTNVDGRRYYLFADDNTDNGKGDRFFTCDLPKDVNLGSQFDMKINRGLNMASREKRSVKISWNNMEVTCEIDVKEMEMLRHYPQVDIPLYAKSVISPTLRESLLKQIKPYVEGLSERDAANKLLHFVQLAFAYATDGDQHGYEKTYFLEENFYYPKNDCEDRAIFYAFLVRNLLGLDVHLIQYPGHECTAVNFTDSTITGDGYISNGKTFIICDPTYIGASIGQCMPEYRKMTPMVQIW